VVELISFSRFSQTELITDSDLNPWFTNKITTPDLTEAIQNMVETIDKESEEGLWKWHKRIDEERMEVLGNECIDG
jgi:hypothetical protein